MYNLKNAYVAEAKNRLADKKRSETSVKIEAKEDADESVVFDSDGVRGTAFEVDYGDLIKARRIDFDGRLALISGDTRHREHLIKHRTGVNLLAHSVSVANPRS